MPAMRTVTALQELSELLTDSQRGYAEAADRIGDPQLEELLMKFGNGRAPMIEELANELALMHEEVPMEGSAKADLQRTWSAIKEKLSKTDAKNILMECERSEKHLLARYDAAISADEIPHHVRELLKGQRVMLNSNLEEVMTLKRSVLQ